jgi:hypothetical protein
MEPRLYELPQLQHVVLAMKYAIAAGLSLLVASAAHAATLTLPSVTIVNPPPPSTAITCNQVSPIPFAPVAPDTVIWNCTVAPSNWTGTLSITGGNSLAVTPATGNAFSVVVGATALAAGTYPSETITATP